MSSKYFKEVTPNVPPTLHPLFQNNQGLNTELILAQKAVWREESLIDTEAAGGRVLLLLTSPFLHGSLLTAQDD